MSAKFPREGGSKPILSHPSIDFDFETVLKFYYLEALVLVYST